jgi:uncharacterized membrane protein
MSTLAVIAYPDQKTAGEAAAALARMQKEYLIELEDVAWVTKAQDGKMQLHQGTYLAGADAATGTMWDFLFGLLFLVPIFGTASGAGAGKLSDYGIDETWIHQAAGAIPFGGSALFVLARNSNAVRAVPEMAKFDGRMFRRFLTSRQQQALENAARPIGQIGTAAPTQGVIQLFRSDRPTHLANDAMR